MGNIRETFVNKKFLYKYYANSKNSIEDPIFTGFTLDIDMLNSPLFYAPYDTTEILRGNGSDTELADKIETRLTTLNKVFFEGSPNTYEINTVKAKDELGDRLAGYGLQDKFYLDNITNGGGYGATDYIYMVDKETEGSFSDDIGITDIGNGTPNRSMYAQQSTVLNSIDPGTDILVQETQSQVNDAVSSFKKIDIFFNLNKSDIRPDQVSSVELVAKIMNDNPDCTVQLDGYADKDTGNPSINMTLSEDRVKTVEQVLMGKGVSTNRITISYHGDKVQPFVGEMNRAVTCNFTGDISEKTALGLKSLNESLKLKSMPDEEGKEQNELINEHEKNVIVTDDAKTTYDDAKKVYDELEQKIKDTKKSFKEQPYNVRSEFLDFQNAMTKDIERYRTVWDGEEKEKIAERIKNRYIAFKDFADHFNNGAETSNSKGEKYSDIYKDIACGTGTVNRIDSMDEDKFKNEMNNLTDDEKKENVIDIFRQAYSVMKSTMNSPKIKSESNNQLSELKEKFNKKSQELYGVHPDNSLGSENNPAGGLYYNYKTAKDKQDNDPYSIQKNKVDVLNDIMANYPQLKQYQDYQNTKRQITPQLPTIDYGMTEAEKNDPSAYANRIREEKNIRKTYEVPQTVYDMLGFINGMRKLTTEYPYVLQTITGLDEAYKKYFDAKEPYQGSGEGKISIDCLEYIDMRITSMFNKYFNAVYDHRYKRERVPINLRRFQCSIFVHDIRNFRKSVQRLIGEVDEESYISNIALMAINYLSAIEFKFFDCEIIPEETGGIFDNVTNLPNNDMRSTKFTFKYGNCVINFLPFEDLKKYQPTSSEIPEVEDNYKSEQFKNEKGQILSRFNKSVNEDESKNLVRPDDGNFRRWFDNSPVGNVNNNDYRDYVRRDSSVAVDDYYKSEMVNDFALNSLVDKNKQLTEMDDALRRIVVGISASTGIPVKGVTDALNIGFIDPILNRQDLDTPIAKNLGNVNNSKIINTQTTEYIGKFTETKEKNPEIVTDLGNVNKIEKGGK